MKKVKLSKIDIHDTLYVQYIIELLFEQYCNSELDSQKYLVQCKFITFIDNNIELLPYMQDYVNLQREKYCMFSTLLDKYTGPKDYVKKENKDTPYSSNDFLQGLVVLLTQ
jgi:hypothetical protein